MDAHPVKTFTKKRIQFCKNYVAIGQESYGNGALSARLAGYPSRTASSASIVILGNSRIQEYLRELEEQQVKQFDWTLDRFKFELDKCYSELPATHANKAKFIELIGKVKRFFEEPTQTFIFASMDRTMVFERVKSITSKLSNTNRLDTIVSLPVT